jgi:hypothetical protein
MVLNKYTIHCPLLGSLINTCLIFQVLLSNPMGVIFTAGAFVKSWLKSIVYTPALTLEL